MSVVILMTQSRDRAEIMPLRGLRLMSFSSVQRCNAAKSTEANMVIELNADVIKD